MQDKVFTIYKVCRVCNGQKEVVVEFTDGSKNLLLCASCQGKGNFIWGYMLDDGQAKQFLTE